MVVSIIFYVLLFPLLKNLSYHWGRDYYDWVKFLSDAFSVWTGMFIVTFLTMQTTQTFSSFFDSVYSFAIFIGLLCGIVGYYCVKTYVELLRLNDFAYYSYLGLAKEIFICYTLYVMSVILLTSFGYTIPDFISGILFVFVLSYIGYRLNQNRQFRLKEKIKFWSTLQFDGLFKSAYNGDNQLIFKSNLKNIVDIVLSGGAIFNGNDALIAFSSNGVVFKLETYKSFSEYFNELKFRTPVNVSTHYNNIVNVKLLMPKTKHQKNRFFDAIYVLKFVGKTNLNELTEQDILLFSESHK